MTTLSWSFEILYRTGLYRQNYNAIHVVLSKITEEVKKTDNK